VPGASLSASRSLFVDCLAGSILRPILLRFKEFGLFENDHFFLPFGLFTGQAALLALLHDSVKRFTRNMRLSIVWGPSGGSAGISFKQENTK